MGGVQVMVKHRLLARDGSTLLTFLTFEKTADGTFAALEILGNVRYVG